MLLFSNRIESSKTECPFCGDVWQEHTLNQTDACMAIMNQEFYHALRKQQQNVDSVFHLEVLTCPVCSRPSEEHTEAKISTCSSKFRKRAQGATGLKLQHEFFSV